MRRPRLSTTGPLFFITNSEGKIELSGVTVNAASGVLLKAAADRWGTSSSNGGTADLTADGQVLCGDLLADSGSIINLTLNNGSSLSGKINAENQAGAVNLAIDASSTWTVTADSYVTSLTDVNGISGSTITNIVGNGHTVHYNSAACPALAGGTYSLVNGGTLTPG